MDRRFWLAIVICVGLVIGHRMLFPPKPAPQTTSQTAPTATTAPTVPGATSLVADPLASPPETVVEQTGLYRITLNAKGEFVREELLRDKYFTNDQHKLVRLPNGAFEVQHNGGYHPTEMIPTYRPSLRFDLLQHTFALPTGAAFRRQPATGDCAEKSVPGGLKQVTLPTTASCTLTYMLDVPGAVRMKKVLTFSPNSYQVPVRLEVTNQGTLFSKYHLAATLESYQDPEQKNGFLARRTPQNEVAWDNNGSLNKITLEKLLANEELEQPNGDIRHISVPQQYFIQALAATSMKQNTSNKQVQAKADSNGALMVVLNYEERNINPQETQALEFVWYAGPKEAAALRDVAVQGEPAGLERTIDYTFGLIARPLLWLLHHIQNFVHNWALSIVLLTMLVKLITLYPTIRSNKSMKAMSALKPEMDALQKRYADDKQKLNEEMMKLYKKHGINPVGGCLPMLIQMPIYIALYSMLSNAVELYHVPLISQRWIQDLTASDPYFILPLVTGALMFLQTRLSPTPPDAQQKAMVWIMPIMFTVFTIFTPAGLTLYILTNTLLGILQQVITNRVQKKPTAVVKKAS